MGRRTILLIAAIIVAALGTVLVWMYADRADDAAIADQSPVQVLVALTDIPSGTTGASISESGWVELTTQPAGVVPPGALSDLTPVIDLVTLGPIFTGQVLLQNDFGSQQSAAGGLTLPEGTIAISVQMGDPQRVAGFVKPGSEVVVFTTGIGLGGEPNEQTTVLLPRALVVAVGPTVVAQTPEGTSSNTEPIPTAILTLALNQVNAQKLILASQSASLYMGLLDAKSQVDPEAPGTTAETLLD